MAMSLALTSGITAFAAPVATGDGNVFDADYYADNNPDVEAAYGRDFNLLYQHFITFGAQEGRLPYAVGTDVSAILGITQQEADAQPEVSQETVNIPVGTNPVITENGQPSYTFWDGYIVRLSTDSHYRKQLMHME